MQTSTAPASSLAHSRRGWFRLLFLFLVVIPFVPEIMIWMTAGVARLMGCQSDQKDACLIGSLPVSDIIALALQAGAGFIIAGTRSSEKWLFGFYSVFAAWLAACYVLLTFGWSRTPSRLALGFGVTLVFSFVPFFGPMLALTNLANENCRPNEGSVGACMIFGSHVGPPNESPAHDAVLLGWLAPYGALLAITAFVVYAIAVIATAVVSARDRTSSA